MVDGEPPIPRAARKVTLPSIPRSLLSQDELRREAATELPAGTQLRHTKAFDIVERIGEGGMGKIYRAYDPVMDRYVALKLLKLDVPEHERRRFRREAVVAADFAHPNLARVLDRGTDHEHGLEWMTMDYLRGRDLGHIIDLGRPIALPLLIDIFAQTLDALEYIHTRNIAHCDVKPDNIFITRDPYDRKIVIVKLIDFGVCRQLEPPLELQKQLIGDPRYMAPEQTVLNGPMDHRVDLYALGITLFEALVGRHPFEGADEMSASELLLMQRKAPIPGPGAFLPDLPPAVRLALDEVVTTACAKDPAARYPRARAMKEALSKVLAAG